MLNEDELEGGEKPPHDVNIIEGNKSETEPNFREIDVNEALELAIARGFTMNTKGGAPKTPSTEDFRKRLVNFSRKNDDALFWGLKKSQNRGKYLDFGDSIATEQKITPL